jgi:hypothetical protein
MFKKWFGSMMAVVAMIAMVGCSSINPSAFDVCSTVSVVQSQQQLVESASLTIVSLHSSKLVSDDVYNKAATAYSVWAQSQPTVVNALVALNDAGGNPSAISIAQYTTLAIQIAVETASFIAIYNNISMSTPKVQTIAMGPVLKPMSKLMAAAPCTITDATITSELAVPAWSAFSPVAPATKK